MNLESVTHLMINCIVQIELCTCTRRVSKWIHLCELLLRVELPLANPIDCQSAFNDYEGSGSKQIKRYKQLYHWFVAKHVTRYTWHNMLLKKLAKLPNNISVINSPSHRVTTFLIILQDTDLEIPGNI